MHTVIIFQLMFVMSNVLIHKIGINKYGPFEMKEILHYTVIYEDSSF